MFSWLVIPLLAVRANFDIIPPQNYDPAKLTAQVVQTETSTSEAECSAPESRWQRHRISPGETIDSIAKTYSLLPETLMRLNSVDSPPVGTELLIPPVNGVQVEVPAGTTWQDLEAAYGIRADVLFELNRCQKLPTAVFLPGVNWGAGQGASDNYAGLSGYPLPAIASVGLGYGWHSDDNQQKLFHSGVDLLADPDTPVLAAEAGTVVYVGQEETYGNLIVVDHAEGRQTRYAHLDSTQVVIGEQVQAGDPLGTVGVTGQPDLATPHLHFEVRYNSPLGWIAQDPEIHLNIGSRFKF